MSIRSETKAANLFKRCIRETLRRPEQLTVSEWAEKYRQLDESSSLSGKWSNTITPYLTEIMDCFNDPYITNINFVKGTQVGGTEALINMLCWVVTQNPSPTMIVYPTDDLARMVSNERLKPAFRKIDDVSKRFYTTKSNEMNLRFSGMSVFLRSGGSPSKLASLAIRYLFFDEIDKMPGAAKGEASPYNLAVERTKTFKYSRKIYTCSTPTHRGNYIWRLHERAEEQRYYFVPCPHCGEYIRLEWKQIKFAPNEENKLTNRERADTAIYICPECGCEIADRDKPKMLKSGVWKNIKEGGTEKTRRARSVSFHLNSLYSFFVSWSDVAFEYLECRDDPEMYQNFVNSWLGEPWEDTKLTVSADLVSDRQAPEPRFTVPDWAVFLTAGVDVQQKCVYFDIVAWGPGLTSQSIGHGQALTLDDIPQYMNSEYYSSDGRRFVVVLCLIDSGDQTDMVYEFCARYDWALPAKGYSTLKNNDFRISNINRVGKLYNGTPLVLVNTTRYKDMIAAKLHVGNGEGSCMVHADCDDDYKKQITSEHKVAEGSGTRRRLVWRTKTINADNHYLDCRVYASAAADMRGIRGYDNIAEGEEMPAPKQYNGSDKETWLEGWK